MQASRDELKRRLTWPSRVGEAGDCAAFVSRALADEAAGRGLARAVLAAKDGALLGVVALQDLDRIPGVAELSGWIRADRQGEGFGRDAFTLMIDEAFKRRGVQRVSMRLEPSNRPARGLAKALGFKYEGCLRRDKKLNGRWIDQECWGLLESD